MICGGSGSSKFASACAQYMSTDSTYDLGFISNVADNYWYHGLYVCPDVDIIMHALSGQLNSSKGWGINSDNYENLEVFSTLSTLREWFSLGSLDSAYCQRRTELIRHGWRLSSITKMFCERLDIRWPIIPATDDEMTTFVRTGVGLMHLQQYWVKYNAVPDPVEVIYQGQIEARANSNSIDYLNHQVIICPANPITSVSPTIGIREVRRKLKNSKVAAISPFVGDKVFSGPASKLMPLAGVEPNSLGVAKLYASFLKLFIIDEQEDKKLEDQIVDMGIECYRTNIRIDSSNSRSIANEIMNIL
ncbi:MAG: YvcK family protein [Nitrososphaerota archaeon]|nr:YvcK family protein [Nitrososphaerota archaeon]